MRSPFSPERWRAISAELDRGLELAAGEERSSWLASLRAEDPGLAADVESLLEEHNALDRDGFLESGAPQRPAQVSLAGLAIGAYTLRSLIGQGGMGSVWLADRSDGRFEGVAAVKLLNASLVGRDGEARFRREGEILARLKHRNIAHLIDAGLSPSGQPYLILEHVDGEPIDRYCDSRRLAIDGRIRLFLDVLDAVAHAHANLIVHRDIKPSNVLVGRDGQIKLLDFGVAKLLEPEAGANRGTALTREGESALTPEFAAPEQLTGGHITTSTDVYALGVLLYVLLTGKHPAGARTSSAADWIHAIVHTEPPRLWDAVTATSSPTGDTAADVARKRATNEKRLKILLRGDLDNIVARTLKKNVSERYASVEALGDDLRRYLAHRPVSARADSLRYRATRFCRRNLTAVSLSLLVLVALAGGLTGTMSQARRANEEARAAVEQRDFALRQLSRAEAINDLNTFLLSDAAPLGKPFTVGELLGRAERMVERQADDPDESRVELLVAIGRQYQLMEELEKALRVLTRAYELSRASPEPATRAEAGCALASVVALAGESERAERLFAEAEKELPNQPQFALHRILCLMRGSEVAQARGDPGMGLERAQAAQRLLDETRFASSLLQFRVSTRVAESYRLAGRQREAVATFEKAFEQLTSLGRDDTERAGTMLNNWALSLYELGQPLAAAPLFQRAIEISSADGTAENIPPMLLNNYARVLGNLGHLDEAARYAEMADRRARQMGNDAVIYQVLRLRASIYRRRGELDRAAAMLRELEPLLERMMPPGHIAFAGLAMDKALLAKARGDETAARSEADRAIAIVEASGYRAGTLASFLRGRAEIEVEVGGADRAAADAERALRLDLESVEPGTVSSDLGLDYLVLGRALLARGESRAAHDAFASAAEHFEPSLGPDHSLTLQARGLAASSASAENP
jgi:serine/threonine-protein kinase